MFKSKNLQSVKHGFFGRSGGLSTGIYSSLNNQGLKDTVNQFSGKNFSEFKKSLSDLLIEKISPISSEINRLNKDISFIDKVLTEGGLKAHEISSKKVKKIKEIIGF